MDTFPLDKNSQGWNSKKFAPLPAEDPSITTEVEGGYAIGRPRHTRPPRRSWTQGWDCASNADKITLETFWDSQKGRSNLFQWTNPDDNVVYVVRFKSPPRYAYMGAGATKLWDMTVELEQV
jgi:hypothetical protein